VEAEGNICTGMSKSGGRRLVANCKVKFLVHELKWFKMSMVGISETRWFGQAVYMVDSYTVVHSGRPMSAAGDVAQRVLILFLIQCCLRLGEMVVRHKIQCLRVL